MRLTISHQTTYRFKAPPTYGLQQLRLTPKSNGPQAVIDWQMQVAGCTVQTRYLDQHQNMVTLVSFDTDAHEVQVTCQGVVDTQDSAGILGKHRGFAPLWYFQRATDLTRAGAGVRALIKGLSGGKADEPFETDGGLARLHSLAARIADQVAYEIGATGPETDAEAAIAGGAGVCQDHAHIFIAGARALGFPARYVSGYLMMEDRVHQDASHAWAEAHVAGLGWVGFDVSNRISPDPRYVRVATGLDYREAAPISGLHYGARGEALAVDIQVAQQ